MSPKVGRPTENPKNDRITVRLDEKTTTILNEYCKQEKTDRATAIRIGINKLEADIKK